MHFPSRRTIALILISACSGIGFGYEVFFHEPQVLAEAKIESHFDGRQQGFKDAIRSLDRMQADCASTRIKTEDCQVIQFLQEDAQDQLVILREEYAGAYAATSSCRGGKCVSGTTEWFDITR